MDHRKRPVTQRVRTVHRWISLCFGAIAIALVVDALVNETTSAQLSLAALVALVLLLVTGGWLLVHHYTATRRASRRRAVLAGARQVAADPE
ncbi:MAG TPA: hypothetical protein VFM07_07380 [Intrasporangium sp.]|nr:hypothetical protein [Intrasporangium sp.]